MIVRRTVLIGMAILVFAPAALGQATAEPGARRQILNVVLVELDTSPDAKASAPAVVNDRAYWERRAPRLLNLLMMIGHKPATAEASEATATLHAVRTTVSDLDDHPAMDRLLAELWRICDVTARPSFLIVWLPLNRGVYLALHDNGEFNASAALRMVNTLRSLARGPQLLGITQSSYVAPPCVLVAESPDADGRVTSPALDDTLIATQSAEPLLHAILGTTAQVLVDARVKTLAQSSPAGAAFERLTPTWSRVMDTLGDMVVDPSHVQIGTPKFGVTYDCGIARTHWQEFLHNTWRPALTDFRTGRLGGILLEPRLEIVLEKNGLTSALATKAVAAVAGKTSGEFTHEDKTFIAVKAPGTQNLFRVPAGQFRMVQPDATLKVEGPREVHLTRYYDSSSLGASPLGPGWSVLPFSLEIAQPVKIDGAKTEVGSRIVLVDHQVGARLVYRPEQQGAANTKSDEGTSVVPYIKVSSALQPDLQAETDGGYKATFAHGLIVSFDERGRMTWVGRTEANRIKYRFDGGRLKEISAGKDAKITLTYDDRGRLVSAKAGDRRITYSFDEAGRLISVTGSEAGPCVFTYGADGRVATVTAGVGAQPSVANTYDASGRMLTHHTPQGEWRFSYDDDIGRAMVTNPQGKQVAYYYDGFQRLNAYGEAKDRMTLLNYDVTGRILQVAVAQLLNDLSRGGRPRFKVSEVVAPLPAPADKDKKE